MAKTTQADIELINRVTKHLESGEYREAAEIIVQEMKDISENAGNADDESGEEFNLILGLLFNIPNTNWLLAKRHDIWKPL